MAQAENVTSAIAAPRIGASAKPSTSLVRLERAELLLASAGHEPHPSPIYPDASDLDDRAENLTKVLTVQSIDLGPVLDDTAQNISGGLNLDLIKAVLSDLTFDVTHAIEPPAHDMAGRLS